MFNRNILNFKLFESSYEYNIDSNYSLFKDEYNNEFKVEFKKLDDDFIEVIYLVKDNEGNWTYNEVETNIFRVTRTIIGEILPEYLNKNDWIDVVLIKGLSKETEKDFISKRTKWYLRFLENNPIKGWTKERDGNNIYLFRN
jgi:predicted DNA-binding protein (MmcQ/YjbR family)